MNPQTTSAIQVASRVHGFSYAIRNIVAEALKVEAAGTRVRYLNIGDPIPFGFKTPPHLIEAVERAMRDDQNGYTPSTGIQSAREAVAADFVARGLNIDADRVLLTAGTSEGLELALSALVAAGFILWMWMWIPGMHTCGVRAVVAWSFDRVAPEALGKISETRHTPTVAIWFCVAITVVFMAMFVFTDFFSTIIILIEAAVLAWSIVLFAGIFFPYTRPEIYEKSPIANKKILGLPMMTVACILGTAGSQFFFWTLWSDPISAGHDPVQLLLVFGIFVIGIVFYFVMKGIRKSQGVDVTLAFKEIPIE